MRITGIIELAFDLSQALGITQDICSYVVALSHASPAAFEK